MNSHSSEPCGCWNIPIHFCIDSDLAWPRREVAEPSLWNQTGIADESSASHVWLTAIDADTERLCWQSHSCSCCWRPSWSLSGWFAVPRSITTDEREGAMGKRRGQGVRRSVVDSERCPRLRDS